MLLTNRLSSFHEGIFIITHFSFGFRSDSRAYEVSCNGIAV